jgi:hypothetical protein
MQVHGARLPYTIALVGCYGGLCRGSTTSVAWSRRDGFYGHLPRRNSFGGEKSAAAYALAWFMWSTSITLSIP